MWTYDFVYDRTETNRVLKLLVVLDEYTRGVPQDQRGVSTGQPGGGRDAGCTVRVREPEHLRSDNGGEFIAEIVQEWLARSGTQTVYIEPGHPWENGYCESFNGKLRDECPQRGGVL